MPTKFNEIYERAVFKFTDYTFLTVPTESKEQILEKYLISALVDFKPACKVVDLSKYDTQTKEFSEELDDEIIEILSLGVAFHWLNTQVLNIRLFRNMIHNKDYTSYSPANLLKELQELRKTIEEEYRGIKSIWIPFSWSVSFN